MAEQFVWDDKATWPRDRKQFVFLASAVEMYGVAEFGPSWRDTHRKEACLAVADAIADENLHFAVRLKVGGEFSALQPVGVFNSEDVLKLFEDCSWPPPWTGALQTVGPFQFPIFSSSYYVFIEKRGFDEWLRLASTSQTVEGKKLPRQKRLIEDWIQQKWGGQVPSMTQDQMLEDIAEFIAPILKAKPGSVTVPSKTTLKDYLADRQTVDGGRD